MRKQRTRLFTLLLGVTLLIMAGWAGADPPARVARLGYTSGAVSFSPAGENDWVLAAMNRPLITGDRLWVDAGARAELQVGAAVIRISGSTSVTLLNLDDRVAQVQLAQGTLNVRVRRFDPNDVFEVATPSLAYTIRRPGEYRIDVDPATNTTTVVVRSGQAEVYGDGAAYVVNAQQAYRFARTDLRDYEYIVVPRADEFDRWSSERERRGAVSARYVSRDVIGYQDLDEHGSWRAAEGYGNVWVPTRVAAGWAPYRDGHWAWVEPWGWTWVDDAPWGFAVSHYGRWAYIRGTWGWVPGPIRSRAVYAPALVAFVGGSNFQIAISSGNVAGVAWFPLGPRDVYRPSYPVSRTYFNNVNTSNTTINITNVANVYNNVNVRNITYINQRVPGAIVAVPSTAFVQSQPVGRVAVRLSKEAIAKAPVTEVAAVAPVQASVRGAAAPGSRPPAEALKRPVVAKAPPPPAPVPFAAKQAALAKEPGKPLDAAGLAAVKPTAPAPAPSVKVVSPTQRAVAPPKRQAVAPGGPQAPEAKGSQPSDAKPREAEKAPRPAEAAKEPPPDVRKGQPSDARKGASRDAEKAPQPPVSVPKPPDAQKGAPPDTQKGPPPDTKKGPPSEAKKAPSREAEKAAKPPVSVPKPPEASKGPPPEARTGSQPSEAKKPSREAEKAAKPPASAPKPPDAAKGSPPDAQKGPPPDAKKGPPSEARKGPSREAEKAPQPPVSVPKPPDAQKGAAPEAQKAPPPDAKKEPPSEAKKVPSREAEKAPKPPVSAPKPPEAAKGSPPGAQKGLAPEAKKGAPTKPEADKAAEKGGEKKSDEQLKREEEDRLRKR